MSESNFLYADDGRQFTVNKVDMFLLKNLDDLSNHITVEMTCPIDCRNQYSLDENVKVPYYVTNNKHKFVIHKWSMSSNVDETKTLSITANISIAPDNNGFLASNTGIDNINDAVKSPKKVFTDDGRELMLQEWSPEAEAGDGYVSIEAKFKCEIKSRTPETFRVNHIDPYLETR